MVGLPGMKPIPDGWAEAHRPVAESTMTAPATFHRITEGPAPYPLPPGWDGSQLIWGGEPVVKVRVQQRSQGAGDNVAADQPTVQRQVLITCPLGGPALRAGERGDIVRAVGREFRIVSILPGSLLWELDLLCVDNLTQQNP